MLKRWRVVENVESIEELRRAEKQKAAAVAQASEASRLVGALVSSREHNHYGERMAEAFAAQRRRVVE